MERLSKIAIYMGMAIACSIFVMFAISVMPHVASQIEDGLGDALDGKSSEEIKKLLYETDSYRAFSAKYPDNGEYYDSHRNGYGRLEVTAMNFESYNTLHLYLEYDARAESVSEEVRCVNQKDNKNYFIRGTLAVQFIENIDCLSGAGLVDVPSNLVDEDGNSVPIQSNLIINGDYD